MYSNTEKNRAKKEKRAILDDRFGFKGQVHWFPAFETPNYRAYTATEVVSDSVQIYA